MPDEGRGRGEIGRGRRWRSQTFERVGDPLEDLVDSIAHWARFRRSGDGGARRLVPEARRGI
jgi:hypothetical protein